MMNDEVQYCSNETCAHCARYHTGDLVCGLPYPAHFGAWSKDMRADVVQCLSYRIRIGFTQNGTIKIQEYIPGRLRDGSYKGQIEEKK